MMNDLERLLSSIHETTDFEDVENMDVNSKGLFENTPLHVAITWRDEEAIKLLLSSGADVNAKGEYGFTPLHRAVSSNLAGIARILLEHGADAKIQNSDGDDCYDLSKKIGNEGILK